MQTFIFKAFLSAGIVLGVLQATPAKAGSDPFIGEIMVFGGNFCPRGWEAAQGQLLPISQNQALFSLYGTMYGGDGRTTFALPDLRGRVPIGAGHGPGLPNYFQGSRGGGNTVITPGKGAGVANTAYQTINICVALVGTYPSRN